jgi:tRNA 5-methylaminomethyl-2-thiouridine biosynthesis bifunctional protein
MSSAYLKKFSTVIPATLEWRDGQPLNKNFDDIYFSSADGLAESSYVFLDGCQLKQDWLDKPNSDFNLLELGFGSGLNFLLTLRLWSKYHKASNKSSLNYISIEKHPLRPDDLKKIHQLWPELAEQSSLLIANYPSTTYGRHQIHFELHNVTLTLLFMSADDALNDLTTENKLQQKNIQIDHWFLDGFAPSKNADMWEDSIVDRLSQLCKKGSRLTTFSAASRVRKSLIKVGFNVTKLKGYGRKREMLTAIFEGENRSNNVSLNKTSRVNLKYETPWFSKSFHEAPEKVAVIGAGIAGCATAYSLAKQGIKVDLFETGNELASQASGVSAGLFHPQLTADMNYNSQFNWLAYLYLLRFINNLKKSEREALVINHGIKRLLPDLKSYQALLMLIQKFDFANWIIPKEKDLNAILYPNAGAINTKYFCELLIKKSQVKPQLFFNTKIEALTQEKKQWVVSSINSDYKYKHVIFCGGATSLVKNQFVLFDTRVTQGQTCEIESEYIKDKLPQSLVEKSYIIPGVNNDLLLGATFHVVDSEKQTENFFVNSMITQENQDELLEQTRGILEKNGAQLLDSKTSNDIPLKGRLGYRLHSQDRLPLVGVVPDKLKLEKDFQHLGQQPTNQDGSNHYNIDGLWLNTAYGSHGLLYSLLASQHLASLISNNISPINQSLSNALSPIRFIVRRLKNNTID